MARFPEEKNITWRTRGRDLKLRQPALLTSWFKGRSGPGRPLQNNDGVRVERLFGLVIARVLIHVKQQRKWLQKLALFRFARGTEAGQPSG